MSKKIIHTNPHLRSRNDRLDRVARSAAVSAAIEDIEISVEESRRIAEEVNNNDSVLRK